LNGIVYLDDGQIARSEISKRYGESAEVAVTIRELRNVKPLALVAA
jgi:Holliday junction resolvase RusA-like endonuclease